MKLLYRSQAAGPEIMVRAVIEGEVHRYLVSSANVLDEVLVLVRDGATYIAFHAADYSVGTWRWWPRIGGES